VSRVVVDLPESLREQLSRQAEREGIPLETYIVYSLTRFVTASDLAAQRAAFDELTSRYPEEQAEAALRDLLGSRQPLP
jgi:hypothetical protein